MKCTNCGFDNAPGARFCENCGQPMERHCPNCGRPVSISAKFCGNCGYNLSHIPASQAPVLASLRQAAPLDLQEKVRAVGKSLEGERKLVTVLFADIVGSVELAEAMDPEDWRDVVTGVHRRVTEAVHHYEGHVAQLLGDGVLAFFGAPLTHEDDAERGVRAALSILEAIHQFAAEIGGRGLSHPLQVRVGLNTGQVVVGNVGSDLHLEYLAIGDTVNLAARVQAAADPDHILITGNTQRLLGGLFGLEDKGLISIKGKADPTHVYCVLTEHKGAVRRRGIAGLDSPMVGRQRELTALRQVTAGLRAGHGAIVSIIGEAGLGKSRLVAEWRKESVGEVDETAESAIRWVEGRCLSYASALPFHLATEILRALLGAGAEEAPDELSRRLLDSCQECLHDGAKEVYPFLAHMLGVPVSEEAAAYVRYLDAGALQARYVAAYRTYLNAVARAKPLVVVADDIQWADHSSAELGTQILSLASEAPIVFVLVARNDTEAAGAELLAAAREVTGIGSIELHLAPLTDQESHVLIENLLRVAALSQQARESILARAEGNPFYVEEVVRMLIDRGGIERRDGQWVATRELANIEIPDTLQGVINARIDRLPEGAKHTLQLAAVIGRRFQARVLQTVSETTAQSELSAQLSRLQAADLVRLVRSQPEPEYWFKHAVIHESVYRSLLKSTRAELHLRVAEAIESLGPRDDNAALLALHYERAGHDRKALGYAVIAGDRALRAYALREAVGFYDRALEMAKRLGEEQLKRELYAVYANRGKAIQLLGNQSEALADFEAQVKVAWRIGEPALQAEALNQVVTMQILGGRPTPELERNLDEALRLAQLSGDPYLVGRTLWNTGLTYRFPEPERAIGYLQQAYDMAVARQSEGTRWQELAGYVLVDMSTANFIRGRLDEARDYGMLALQTFRNLDHRPMIGDALGSLGMISFLEGDAAAARRALDEEMEIARGLENDWLIAYGSAALSMVEADAGRLDRAVRAAMDGLAAARIAGFAAITGLVQDSLSYVYFETGRPDLGEAAAEEAAKALSGIGAPMWSALARSERGRVALSRGEYERAWELFAPLAVDGDERRNDLEALIFACEGIARAGFAAGHYDEVRRFLDWFTPRMQQYRAWRRVADLFYWYGRLDQADGNWSGAEDFFLRARELYEKADARVRVWRTDEALADLCASAGDWKRAAEFRERAAQLACEIAANIEDLELRRSFLAAPDISRLLAA